MTLNIEDDPELVTLDGSAADADMAGLAAYALSLGSLVVVPTDTVYALAARALDGYAVARAFEVKGRDRSKKLPLLIGEPEDLERYGRDVADYARTLAGEHWPGALTIVVRAAGDLPLWLVDERGTVALRCPDHAFVREVSRMLGEPLAATSVNFTGQPAATEVTHIPDEILESVDLVVDGGPTGSAVSTVVDCSDAAPRLLRAGAVPLVL